MTASTTARAAPQWLRRPGLVAGSALVALFVLLALLGPPLAPYDAYSFIGDSLAPPSDQFWLGTDQFGRDVLSRIIVGTRSILTMASLSTLVALVAGALLGLISGYMGGLLDEVIMRLLDGIMAIPALLTALLILAVLGPSTVNVILAIGVVFVPVIARLVRSAVLSQVNLEYIEAARVRGESAFYIMLREILPNISGPIAVEASIRFSFAILSASSLGFLGMGVQPPTPDWGLMVSEGRNFITRAPWMVLFPSAAIAALVVGVNLLTDGLREALDVVET